ncbi:MAG: glucose-6-phosphate isomerase [Candidatus Margulisiibacteriota bacterium]|nr:MAG: glucose-6-phosphate isomerase [Candidatus Margulisbacteria bacterium GWD2_39_127]OGI01401.1 MAG: glucose-6-phosphate isomerase [Candidatus Margulisbacteria bacterium GWF2_38_17]OGI10319.1 MAG: glucose-6-phosphate isomerase [Candidatus Margulisbacteria bacterium GWE2_39_32]PZM84964.1 MAG: glucose-6-phosphate isomerase [Candidatus Margulisiibacteriota bacterium]HAR62016.1 glucose-6-phosphate isomerase [Candidatus Margulisiibacteriota bacterium]
MTDIKYNNLNEAESFGRLKDVVLSARIELKDELTAEKISKSVVNIGDLMTYNYAAKAVNTKILSAMQKLADEQQVIDKYKVLLNGEVINTGEKRKVLHQLTRGQLGNDVFEGAANLRDFYVEQQNKIYEFARKVHSGEIKGSTGKPFDTVVQIGIGGSDLGPRALYMALKNYVEDTKGKQPMKSYFVSNVDPDDANEVLRVLNFETTLFILVSKSGTTQETLTNEVLVREKVTKANIPGMDVRKHFVAITSETSPLAKSSDFLTSFFINDFIGGRFSSTSAVGGAILTLAFGQDIFGRLLKGAHASDKNALNPDILKNASLLDALIGVCERNILDYQTTAILPYSQALSRFPAHLQQLDMESNGKSVNRNAKPIDYKTGPIIFGEPGTNGQHSFYQLLHQGTDVIPLQFIGFKHPQISADFEFDNSTSQMKLNANMVAQIVAFAKGKSASDPNKTFSGNRPSSLLFADKLTPEVLGAILAHFENKVMFQGFIWNVNSFDQEGVQLGKVLTGQVLRGGSDLDPALACFAQMMGL